MSRVTAHAASATATFLADEVRPTQISKPLILAKLIGFVFQFFLATYKIPHGPKDLAGEALGVRRRQAAPVVPDHESRHIGTQTTAYDVAIAQWLALVVAREADESSTLSFWAFSGVRRVCAPPERLPSRPAVTNRVYLLIGILSSHGRRVADASSGRTRVRRRSSLPTSSRSQPGLEQSAVKTL